MIIELPDTFNYASNDSHSTAYVRKGVLYIDGHICFEKLMYTLTYDINGEELCGYCNKIMAQNERTLDHKFPRTWGGVSITNNLIPSCKQCNRGRKRTMTSGQFMHWKKQKTGKQQRDYYKRAISRNKNMVENGELVLPKDWIVDYDITKILEEIEFDYIDENSKKQLIISEYYNKHQKYQHPIVVSSDGCLLDGHNIVFHAKKHDVKVVRAIVLENVVKIRSS